MTGVVHLDLNQGDYKYLYNKAYMYAICMMC